MFTNSLTKKEVNRYISSPQKNNFQYSKMKSTSSILLPVFFKLSWQAQGRETETGSLVLLQVLHREAWGQGLLQLVRFIGIKHTQGVEVLLAPHLELHHILAALYLHGPRVLPARC